MLKNEKIYLDYSATTPIDQEVFAAMAPYLKDIFGNASSIHRFGQEARQAVDSAREKVARCLGCQASEIIFTGGATESNNLALKGAIRQIKVNSKSPQRDLHIIVSAIEHHSVMDSAKALAKEGIRTTFLPVSQEGIISAGELEKAIEDNTVLISIMYANNEIGAIQPIAEIGQLLKKIRQKKGTVYPLFHTDAVQALAYLDCDVSKLGVDMLTISAHKIYGPKGVGALFVKKGVPLARMQDGGNHEMGRRAGTMNVAGIVGLGAAVEFVSRTDKKAIENLRDILIDGILKKIDGAVLNGDRNTRLPNNANFSFPGAEGEAIVISLDQEGIAASTGSACAAEGLEPSHVMRAIGMSDLEAHSSLRLTLGKYTTKKEIERVLETLPPIIERLRKLSGGVAKRFGKKSKAAIPDDFGC